MFVHFFRSDNLFLFSKENVILDLTSLDDHMEFSSIALISKWLSLMTIYNLCSYRRKLSKLYDSFLWLICLLFWPQVSLYPSCNCILFLLRFAIYFLSHTLNFLSLNVFFQSIHLLIVSIILCQFPFSFYFTYSSLSSPLCYLLSSTPFSPFSHCYFIVLLFSFLTLCPIILPHFIPLVCRSVY